jgi:Predicted transcriptional regulators
MSNDFSGRLRSLRGERSKAEFARFLGVSAPVYQRYEDGRIPRADALQTIAERLSVSVEWLVSGNSPPIGNSQTDIDWRSRAIEAERKLESIKAVVRSLTDCVNRLEGIV